MKNNGSINRKYKFRRNKSMSGENAGTWGHKNFLDNMTMHVVLKCQIQNHGSQECVRQNDHLQTSENNWALQQAISTSDPVTVTNMLMWDRLSVIWWRNAFCKIALVQHISIFHGPQKVLSQVSPRANLCSHSWTLQGFWKHSSPTWH